MALQAYLTEAVGGHRERGELVASALLGESMDLRDLALLREEHLAKICPELKMGPRLRLLKYIEDTPPPDTDPVVEESGRAGADATNTAASPGTTATTTPALPTGSRRSSGALTKSRRVSKSLLKAQELTSVQFMKLWSAVAGDGVDRLEGDAVALFLDALLQARSVTPLSKDELRDGRQVILDGFGTADGALEIGSMQQLLSVEECFLLDFRSKCRISSVDLMRVFTHYDEDSNGKIQQAELQGLLRDLLARDRADNDSSTTRSVLPSEITDYTEVLLEMFDTDHDGKISLSELSRMLCTEASYLDRLKGKAELTKKEFRKIFRHFDRDKSGSISGAELLALAWDELRSENGADIDSIGMPEIKVRASAMLELAVSDDGNIFPVQLAVMLGLDTALAQ